MASTHQHRLLKRKYRPDFRDLTILRDHANPSVNIIAVHGLAADPIGTWVEKSQEWNWLEHQLVEIVPGARMWTFGYDSTWLGEKAVDTRLTEVAGRLLDAISIEDLLPTPLIFVAHSFGGIVVLKALMMAEMTNNDWAKHGEAFGLFRYTDAAIFFGSPFRGIHEWFQNDLPGLAAKIHRHVEKGLFESFRHGSDVLDELRKGFMETSHVYKRPNVGCLWETQESNVGRIVGNEEIPKVMLVSKNDAILVDGPSTGEPRFVARGLERDHFNMHNFGKDDRVFRTVAYVLKHTLSPEILQHADLSSVMIPLTREDQECIRSLSYPEMDDRYFDISNASQNTCAWLLQHQIYQNWLHQFSGLLWIKGKPGAGKSTLMKFAADQERQNPQRPTLATFFFHARGTALQKTSIGLYRSLLHQLLYNIPSLRSEFRSICKRKQQTQKEWSWHVNELQELLYQNIRRAAEVTPVSIFVDALDECGSEEAAKLALYLQDLIVKLSSVRKAVHICFSSRHYPNVTLRHGLEILVESETQGDIATYIGNTFEMEGWNTVRDSLIVEALQINILRRASGIFQWVSLVLKLIAKLARVPTPWKAIQERIQKIPQELSDLYTYMLETLDEESRFEAWILIRWVHLAERPLSTNELRTALAFDTETPYPSLRTWRDSNSYYEDDFVQLKALVTSLSGGLAEVVGEKDHHVVQFIHESVNDYLNSNGMRKLHTLVNDDSKSKNPTTRGDCSTGSLIGQCHHQIARACIYFIKNEEILRTTFKRNLHITSLPSDMQFVMYATEFWLSHSQEAESENCSQEEVLMWLEFPSNSILRQWVYIHQILCPYSDENFRDPRTTFLHVASAAGLLSLVQALLAKPSMEVNVRGLYNRTPLHSASEMGHTAIISLLLSQGADVNAQSESNETALYAASENGHDQVVQMLLDKGADVNVQGGYYGNALQAAVHRGHDQVVQMLLDKGADVNAQGGYYGNALQAASYEGHERVMQMLLDKGADVNAQGGDYGNALQAASDRGFEKGVQMLLNKGADVNAQGGRYGNALQVASNSGNERVMQMLLDKGAGVNVQGGFYGNALQAASYEGHERVMQMLLDKGADVNAQGGYFGNALQAAVHRGHDKVMHMLLDKGADVNVQGGSDGSALQVASWRGFEKVMQMLLDKGADVNAQGGDYGNALQAASYSGVEKAVQMLFDKGADVNVQGGYYGNALQAASENGHDQVAQMLLQRGAISSVLQARFEA